MFRLDLGTAALIDFCVLFACGGLILARGGASKSHPAVLYLIFHFLVVTSRASSVLFGAPTFFSGIPGYEAVRLEELGRAVIVADLALVGGTFGWITGRRWKQSASPQSLGQGGFRPLRTKPVYAVALVAVPPGIVCFALYGFVPGVRSAALGTDFSTVVLTWPGLVLIALIYCRGFKLRYLAPLALYLAVIALQGYGRFRFIVPVLLLVQIYLDRRNRRWPSRGLALVLVATALLFFPLKQIGLAVQAGEDIGSIRAFSTSSVRDAASGQSGDQVILDELALAVSLADESNKVFFGRPYLNILVLPIPRSLWSGKPGLADQLGEISKPSRPLFGIGGVATLPGDLYLNFRLPGVMFGMFLLARLSGRLYIAAYSRPYRSVGRFAFLLLSSNLIQIYRDGLISVPLFLLVHMLPLAVIVALHAPSQGRVTSRQTENRRRQDEEGEAVGPLFALKGSLAYLP